MCNQAIFVRVRLGKGASRIAGECKMADRIEFRQDDKAARVHAGGCPCCSGISQLFLDEQKSSERSVTSGGSKADLNRNTAPDIAEDKTLEKARMQSLGDELSRKFGVQQKDVDGLVEFSFRADGREHVLMRTPATLDGMREASEKLKAITTQKIEHISSRYKVSFAKPGEFATVERKQGEECATVKGENVYARQPTLPQLIAVDEALQRSEPSQLVEGKDEGVKIYFLDKRIYPPVYGGRQILGMQVPADKDGRPATFITPDGAALPPTEKDIKDAAPGNRNLKWVLAHELTHNSQQNMWLNSMIPKTISDALGWDLRNLEKDGKVLLQMDFALKGKNGEYYSHNRNDCKSDSVWYLANKDADPLNAEGQKIEKISEAPHFTNDEVIARAKVKPITYYFGNPREMHSEGLTAFRYDRATRLKLMQESPEMYKTVKEYDQQEIAKFYGTDQFGRGRMVRLPSGALITRTPFAERSITRFEGK